MTKAKKRVWLCVLCVAAAIGAPAQTFKTLVSFDSGNDSEEYPQYMSLVQGVDGELYGTTTGWAQGNVFKVTTLGQLTTLCWFGEDTCVGSFPFAGLIQATDGNLYGTTWQGNATDSHSVWGSGAVYKTTPNVNTMTGVYSFCSLANCADGGEPYAPLIQARNGDLYGTTYIGGAKGYGTVYELTAAGTLTTLHSFGFADGAGPVAGLIQATNGNFYGTTLYGGTHGHGTVYEITPAGALTTLYSFCSQKHCADGAEPYAGLAQAKDGNFYGTTYGGGANGHGTVFQITPAGRLTTLYSFCSLAGCTDGAHPYAGVIQATDGNFYGVTSQGGSNHWGTIFEITADGKLTTLHSFCGLATCADGADPVGGLLQASDGNLYGTTAEGGAYEGGTVFSQSLGMSTAREGGARPPLDDVGVRVSLVENPHPNVAKSATLGWGARTTEAGAEKVPAVTSAAKAAEENKALVAALKRCATQNRNSSAACEVVPFHNTVPQGLRDSSLQAPKPVNPANLTCSPAPCVLPPTQASEGGHMVTDPLIVTDPLNQKELLLGSADDNCGGPAFHLSRDGGSSWSRVLCMPTIYTKDYVYFACCEPHVGYDRNGVAYVTGLYGDNEGDGTGFVGLQKSSDGTNWSKPVVALGRIGGEPPYDTGLAVDDNGGSPFVNNIYVSGTRSSFSGGDSQIVFSHSSDGGATWKQVAVTPMKNFPVYTDNARLAIGKDGTVYLAWRHCVGVGPDVGCNDGTNYVMLSTSADAGDTWSKPHLMTKIDYAFGLASNNNSGGICCISNYPIIAVDNSSGPHAGNLYVVMDVWTGTHVGVQVVRSTDGGKTWSQPVPVSPPSATHDQFYPALSVSPTGLVGVSWLDRRNDPANNNYQAFAAFSADGGKTFGRDWQLTQAFSNPNLAYWMGDYTGNTWAGQDFIAAWMDSSNGVDMQEVVGGLRLR